jgi:hypothetical protein
VREAHLATNRLHRVDLGLQPHRRTREILELLSLDVVGRPEETDGLHRRRPALDGHVVHAVKRGQCFGPKPLGERRSPGALVDVPIRGHRHNQDVAHAPGRLQVLDVADVQQVEAPMAVHHLLTPTPRGVEMRRDRLDRPDLALRHLRPPLWVRRFYRLDRALGGCHFPAFRATDSG